jgi:hypothetical protein
VRRLVRFLLDPDSLLPRLYALELVNPSPAFASMGPGASQQSALASAVQGLLGPQADPRLAARCDRVVELVDGQIVSDQPQPNIAPAAPTPP